MAQLAVTSVEAVLLASVGGVLLLGWGRDLRGVLRGTLVPMREGHMYWRVLYAWALLGIPLGAHRMAVGHVTWKIFAICNAYGALLLLLAEGAVRLQTDAAGNLDPADQATVRRLCDTWGPATLMLGPATLCAGACNPMRWSLQLYALEPATLCTQILFCDALGSALMATPLVMWLRDMRCVLRGTLSLRPEDAPPARPQSVSPLGSAAAAPHLSLLALGGATHPRSASG